MRTHLLAPLALFCVVASGPRNASGWVFEEHRLMSETAFSAGCVVMEKLHPYTPASQEVQRWLCTRLPPLDDPTPPLKPRRAEARLHGLAAALAGDMLEKPEDFFDNEAQYRVVAGFWSYMLAAENGVHFQPGALDTFRAHCRQALERATAARNLLNWTARDGGIREALAHEAFAFAAGHMGFSRPGSSAGPSALHHDGWPPPSGRRLASIDRLEPALWPGRPPCRGGGRAGGRHTDVD